LSNSEQEATEAKIAKADPKEDRPVVEQAKPAAPEVKKTRRRRRTRAEMDAARNAATKQAVEQPNLVMDEGGEVEAAEESQDMFGGIFTEGAVVDVKTPKVAEELSEEEVGVIRNSFAILAGQDYNKAKGLLSDLGASRFAELTASQMQELQVLLDGL